MAGALGVGGDLTRWSEAELVEAATYVEQYKALRTTIQTGEQYRLGSPADGAHAVQYVARDRAESVVLQWRAGPADRAQAPGSGCAVSIRTRGTGWRTTADGCPPGRYAAVPRSSRTGSPPSCRPATASAGC